MYTTWSGPEGSSHTNLCLRVPFYFDPDDCYEQNKKGKDSGRLDASRAEGSGESAAEG